MGYAVAEAAAQRGAKVILISGPTALETPAGVTRVDVRTAAEMLNAVEATFRRSHDGDFCRGGGRLPSGRDRFRKKSRKPAAKSRSGLSLIPIFWPRIARKKGNRIVVGFAAETEKVAENARKKLKEKNADLIVANDVTAEGAGFDVDTNVVTLFARDGRDLAASQNDANEMLRTVSLTKWSASPPASSTNPPTKRSYARPRGHNTPGKTQAGGSDSTKTWG